MTAIKQVLKLAGYITAIGGAAAVVFAALLWASTMQAGQNLNSERISDNKEATDNIANKLDTVARDTSETKGIVQESNELLRMLLSQDKVVKK